MAITRLADLPLSSRDPLDLLALQHERVAPDRDYAGFGWAWVDELELAAPVRPSVWLPRALVLALHSADEQPDDGSIELEFELPDNIVRAPLSAVLDVALGKLPRADDIVLALCNPRNATVRAPAGFASVRLHYAHGDVTSWLDRGADDREHIRLAARRWFVAPPAPP